MPSVALLFADATPARDGANVTGFSGVAYSGEVVPNYGWRGDMAIDLASLSLPSTDVPVLLNHDPNQIVGRATLLNDGRQLTVTNGRFSSVTDNGKQVAALMAEGHPWALSVGINGRPYDADRSKPSKLNGRSLPVDTVMRNSRLLELSFVPSGADPRAYAARLSARGAPSQTPSEDSMDPEEQAAALATANARITELQAQVATLTTERDTARAELNAAATNARNADIVALFGEKNDLTEAQLGAYRGMTTEQFATVRDAITASRKGADPTLFQQAATHGREADRAPARAGYAAPVGYAVDPERAALHAKALKYQADHPNTEYVTALAAVTAAA